MTYTKTQYVDGVTPLNAKNFNKNEGALEQVSKDIDSLSSAITQVDSKVDGKANSNHTHTEYATTSSLNNKVDKVAGKGLSTNDFTTVEKNKLANLQNPDVNKAYVDTELAKKSDKSSTYTKSEVDNKIAEAQLGGGEVDLSGLATKEELNTKADKSHAHSEYSTTNHTHNYASNTHNHDNTYASKSSEHNHTNISALDKVTDSKISSWDSKATGNHNHNGTYAPISHRHNASEIDGLESGGGVDLTGYATEDFVMEKLGGKKHVYLTQVEYDALTEEQKNDETIVYAITDAEDKDVADLKLTGSKLDLINKDGVVIGNGVTLPAGGSSDVTKAYVDSQDKLLDNKIDNLSVKVDNHLANHPSGEGGSFEIITPNGRTIKVKAMNDGTLETELPVIPTSELPSDFPKFTVTGESPYKGNFFITPHDNNYKFGYFIIINRKGEVLYYKKTNKGLVYAPKKYVNSKGKNRYTFLEVITGTEPSGVGFYEHSELVILNENFDEIDRVRHKKFGDIPHNFPTENHDYTYIDDGHYILSSYYKLEGSSLYENSIQELKNGKVLFHWQTKDHAELKQASHTTPTGDYAHFNALQTDIDGNWIVSFRNIGIVKINRQSNGEVMWVMGRNRNDFKGLTQEQICHQQHDIQLRPDGSFTVFDNDGHSTKSRVCRYVLDEQTMTCLSYKEYITTRSKSGFMGSATIVDDKNDILDIAYGSGWSDIAFEEYDFKNKKQLMLLRFNDGSDMYRVYRDLDFCNSSRLDIHEPPINVSVESISLKPSTTLNINETEVLTPTITPSNATNKNVTWSTSDETKVTVNNVGVVTAKAEGSATITVTTVDGNKTSSCNVTVTSIVTPEPDYVTITNFESGSFSANGEPIPYANEIRTADFISVPSGKNKIYYSEILGVNIRTYFYDSNKVFLSQAVTTNMETEAIIPPNASFFKFRLLTNDLSTTIKISYDKAFEYPFDTIVFDGSQELTEIRWTLKDPVYHVEYKLDNKYKLSKSENDMKILDDRFKATTPLIIRSNTHSPIQYIATDNWYNQNLILFSINKELLSEPTVDAVNEYFRLNNYPIGIYARYK